LEFNVPFQHKYGYIRDEERLGIDNINAWLQQNKLRWYGHVLRKHENDWVKNYMDYVNDSFGKKINESMK